MIIIFWILLGIVIYTYLGYTIILAILASAKRLFSKKESDADPFLPEITLLVTAYNELPIIDKKVENTHNIDYPKEKIKVVWITDGSDDGSSEQLKGYNNITVLHQSQRKGKTAALNRAVKTINTPFIVFSDANTIIDKFALREIVAPFRDPEVGCVAGEKQIIKLAKDDASGSGEGFYWQYESLIKRLESDVNSTLGAAGELYAIRTNLFQEAKEDTLIDDFVISLKIAQKKYKIKYAPKAISCEDASLNIKEELKRKIRIASGGFQTLFRYPSLLNIFRHGFLSFQYFSHKVLRWLVVPFSFPLIFLLNLLICMSYSWIFSTYLVIFFLQLLFYLLVILGSLIEKKSTRIKSIFIPYYLIIMNYAQVAGLLKYLSGKQSVSWDKAKRNDQI